MCIRDSYDDSETGFYYLQSRYYDPENHRFINADCIAKTAYLSISTNVFVYCLNSPVYCIDSSGTDAIWLQERDSACLLYTSGGTYSDAVRYTLEELDRGSYRLLVDADAAWIEDLW